MQGLLPQGGLWPEGDALNRPRVQIGFSHAELLLVGDAGPELVDRHRVGGRGKLDYPSPLANTSGDSPTPVQPRTPG